MKPNWENAPKWANYLVQSCKGYWLWTEERPYMSNNDIDWRFCHGRILSASINPTDAEFFRLSLEARPSVTYKFPIGGLCHNEFEIEYHYTHFTASCDCSDDEFKMCKHAHHHEEYFGTYIVPRAVLIANEAICLDCLLEAVETLPKD